ncbi:hypothetical protein [Microbacterium sp. 179-I 3D3 NHS]|uniref:hypothetical protein n=1 Tax=Microbacterium sp. 179-I 3D3 NHS TaxID=3142382 RepID=UPI0039A2B0CC
MADLYVRLLRGRPRSTEEIRALAPAGLDLATALEALEAGGLIAVGREGLEIRDPRAAVPQLIEAQLERRRCAWASAATASADLATLVRAWNEPARTGTAVPGTVAVGDAAEWWRSAMALPGASGIAAPSLAQLPGAPPTGIRLLVAVGELRDAAVRRALSQANVRAVREVPGWLAVGDAVALGLRWRESAPSGATLTDDGSIVAALTWLFDDAWDGAVAVDRLDVFALLGLGCGDGDIAAILDTSVRTVQRRIGEAMAAVGARSRFELGIAWARTPEVVATAGNGMGN